MSFVELHSGTFVKVDTGDLTAEEYLKSLRFGSILFSHEDPEVLMTKKYIILNGELYLCNDIEYKDSEFIAHIIDTKTGTYYYITRFYNGGTCLTESLEEGLKNINNETNSR